MRNSKLLTNPLPLGMGRVKAYSRVREMLLEDARAIYANPEIGKYGAKHMYRMVSYDIAPEEDYEQLRNDYPSEWMVRALQAKGYLL